MKNMMTSNTLLFLLLSLVGLSINSPLSDAQTTSTPTPTAALSIVEIACASYSSTQDLNLLKSSLILGAGIESSLLVDFSHPTASFPYYCFHILLPASSAAVAASSSGSGGATGTSTLLAQLDVSLVSRLVNDRHIALLSPSDEGATTTTSSVRLTWLPSIKAEPLEDLTGNSDETFVWGTRFDLFAFVVVLSLAFVGIILLCLVVRCCCQVGTDKNRASTYFKNSLDAYDGEGADKQRRRPTTTGDVGAFYLDEDDEAVLGGICDDHNPTTLNAIGGCSHHHPNQPLGLVLSQFAVSSEIADHLEETYLTLGGIRTVPAEEVELQLDSIDCTPAEKQRIWTAISTTRF